MSDKEFKWLKILLVTVVGFVAGFMIADAARADCNVQLGLGYHAVNADDPEISGLSNPLGDIEVTCDVTSKLFVSVAHTSSLTTFEDGYGLNAVWVKVKLPFIHFKPLGK